MIVALVVPGRDDGGRGSHRLQEPVGHVTAAVMTGLRHVAEELGPLAGVVLEQGVLTPAVQVAREEDARPAVVDAEKQAHAVRILALAAGEAADHRLAVHLEFHGAQDADGRLALVVRAETGEMTGDVAEAAHGSRCSRRGAALHDLRDEVAPPAVQTIPSLAAHCVRGMGPVGEEPRPERFAVGLHIGAEGLVARSAPPREAGVMEGLDGDGRGIELIDVRRVHEIAEATVMVCVAMGCDQCIQGDGALPVIPEELPVHEVGGVLSGVLEMAGISPVDHDVPESGRLDEDAVALPHIDEIHLEQRFAAERAGFT